MAVLLGLVVAVTYGAADFCGGLSARRASTLAVVLLSQLISIVLLVPLLALLPDASPTGGDLTLGALSGVVGCGGLALLYFGLANGRMSVVAPITAVGAALLPMAWGLAIGERPSPAALVGAALALAAASLIARGPGKTEGDVAGARPKISAQREVLVAAGAGAGFGGVFVLLGALGDDAGAAPLLAARVVSVSLLTLVAVAGRRSVAAARGALPVIAAAGILDVSANGIYLLAVREGLVSLVGVLSSLYPASTVVLARIVLGERLGRLQTRGLGLAAVGVALIAAG